MCVFLSQSESLCLQVQELQVDLNLIACSAAMSARLSSSDWPVQLDLFPHVSSLRIHSTLKLIVSFSTVGFTHDGTGTLALVAHTDLQIVYK